MTYFDESCQKIAEFWGILHKFPVLNLFTIVSKYFDLVTVISGCISQGGLIMSERYIPIISGSHTAKVKVSDIVMVERNRRKLHVVTDAKEYEYYEKIENVELFLDGRFYPCLKGCYINFERVSHMEDQRIYFDNGRFFDLGRENYIKTKQKYRGYLRKTI